MGVMVIKFDPEVLVDELAFFAVLILVLVNLLLKGPTACLRDFNRLSSANSIWFYNSSLSSNKCFSLRRVQSYMLFM